MAGLWQSAANLPTVELRRFIRAWTLLATKVICRAGSVDNSACRVMHVFAHFAHFLLHSGDGGTQLLNRHVPVNDFLRLSPCWRIGYSEIVHKKDNKDSEEHAR
jgi:hypothetical protein